MESTESLAAGWISSLISNLVSYSARFIGRYIGLRAPDTST